MSNPNAINAASPQIQLKVDTIILDKLSNEKHGLKGLTNFLSKVSNKAEYIFKTAARGLKAVTSNIYAKFRSVFSKAYFKTQMHHLDSKIDKYSKTVEEINSKVNSQSNAQISEIDTQKRNIAQDNINLHTNSKLARVNAYITDAVNTLNEEIRNGTALTNTKSGVSTAIGNANNDIAEKKNGLLNTAKSLLNERSNDAQVTDSNKFNQEIGKLKDKLTTDGNTYKETVFSLRNLKTKEQLLSNRQDNAAKRIEKAVIELANRLESPAYKEALENSKTKLPTAQEKLRNMQNKLEEQHIGLLVKLAEANSQTTTVFSRAIAYLEAKLSPRELPGSTVEEYQPAIAGNNLARPLPPQPGEPGFVESIVTKLQPGTQANNSATTA